jgi:glycosyltransferase involved in cell wall biosynthesis
VMLTAVIPAHNEEKTIYEVAKATRQHADEVIVVDDGSVDATAQMAREAGARIVTNGGKRGYIEAIKAGLRQAEGDIIVTIDADGEHNPENIPLVVKPIYDGKADLSLGTRGKASRISENLINWLTNLKVRIPDSCTGFRALSKCLALELNLKGRCTCGILVLEAHYCGAKITGVPVETMPTDKPRAIAWHHIGQTFYVLGWLLRKKRGQIDCI